MSFELLNRVLRGLVGFLDNGVGQRPAIRTKPAVPQRALADGRQPPPRVNPQSVEDRPCAGRSTWEQGST
jgi:hypothetical protein